MEIEFEVYDSLGVPIHNVVDLTLRTTCVKRHGENFKEGSIPVYLVGARTTF